MIRLAAIAALTVCVGAAQAQDLPPTTAEPGTCFAKVLIPPEYEERKERVVAREAAEKVESTPATYETVAQRVVVREESFEYVVTPAVYETVQERVQITPEKIIQEVTPATFKTVEERVEVTPSRIEWKPGRGAYESLDESTGEILCRVEVPAVYKTVTKQVVDKPARTIERTVPAKYVTIEKRVVKTPASAEKKIIPAQYRTVEVEKLVTPAASSLVKIPEEYREVVTRVKVKDERAAWREILCETNTTPDLLRRIQLALRDRGYDPGAADGVMGKGTLTAVRRYQLAKGLPTGGLTLSTLDDLGVKR